MFYRQFSIITEVGMIPWLLYAVYGTLDRNDNMESLSKFDKTLLDGRQNAVCGGTRFVRKPKDVQGLC